MKYMGSKNRIAKEILPIILKGRKENQYYVEPFAGGFNMIDKVDGLRIASDTNEYLIALFKELQNGWIPPSEITESEYNEVRTNKEKYPLYYVGFVGFCCSYSGKWFGGYARGNDNNGNPRNYTDESKRNLLKQKKGIKGICIFNESYDKLQIPKNSIIYLDPPYEGTTGYKDKFDSPKFWDWCRKMKSEGHTVFVSEYDAPEDFAEVWSKKVNNSLTKNTGSKQGVEKLFTLHW